MRTKTTVLLFAIVAIVAIGRCEAAQEGWFASIGNKVSNVWPFTNSLGNDWSDTQERMEAIYRHHHDLAKQRVEDLREDVVEAAHLQDKVADIYQVEMMKAEKEIEKMKHPLSERLMSWRRARGDDQPEPTESEKRGFLERFGLKKPTAAELQPSHLFEDTSKKISDTYKQAVGAAKGKLSEAGASLGANWDEAKAKAAHAYSEAFHRGHGEARSRWGQFRDAVDRGIHGAARTAKNIVSETFHVLLHALNSTVSLVIGAFLGVALLHYYGKRKFRKQLNANIPGPVMAVGEYLVCGNEEKQRKFVDYWTGPAANYFQRQPGLRKYWMHRGLPGMENAWLCYSEWASIEDLRRACNTQEFNDLKRNSPMTFSQMVIYQMVSTGGSGGREGEQIIKEGPLAPGLRQRSSTSTT